MNLEKLAFQLDRLPPSYCEMFEVEEKDRDRQDKYLKYSSKLKFYEMRRHNGLVKFVEGFRSKIFQYPLEDIQQTARESFPELDPEAVNEEVRRMYEDE